MNKRNVLDHKSIDIGLDGISKMTFRCKDGIYDLYIKILPKKEGQFGLSTIQTMFHNDKKIDIKTVSYNMSIHPINLRRMSHGLKPVKKYKPTQVLEWTVKKSDGT